MKSVGAGGEAATGFEVPISPPPPREGRARRPDQPTRGRTGWPPATVTSRRASSTWTAMRRAALPPLCGLLLAACGAGGGFPEVASTAGSELAAAAATVEYVHTGRLPASFARASFVNYRSALKDTERQLRTADGAPAGAELDRLLGLYRPAWQAVQEPCLGNGCDWRGQVRALRAAADGLEREAGG